MGQIGKLIAATAGLGRMHAEKLLTGITADSFSRLARPGGAVIQSNHPAWVFGHLNLYPKRVIERLVEAQQTLVAAAADREFAAAVQTNLPATQYPTTWDELFKNGAVCQDDPERRIYPPMETLTRFFFDSYAAAIAVLATAPDALLTAQNPADGRMRELFPMLGSMLNFYVDGHRQTHFGQISAWRRMMGLGAA